MGNLPSDTIKTAKQTAQQIAKQIAREPAELGRVAVSSVSGIEKNPDQKTSQPSGEVALTDVAPEDKAKIEQQSKRLMLALEQELDDIRKQKKFEENEQKQKEQKEIQKLQELSKEEESPQVSSKPSRKFGEAVKTQIQRLKRSTETRIPPSG